MKKAKKFVVLALLAAIVCSALPAMAWDPEKQKNLGQDHVKMQWYLLDYGTKEDGTPFAISRKYYTNESIKQETIDLLISKYSLPPEVASSLYFTTYVYEYTQDGTQFAEVYIGHYDMLGNRIYDTVRDNSTEENKKLFNTVDPNHAVGKALALALPKPATRRN